MGKYLDKRKAIAYNALQFLERNSQTAEGEGLFLFCREKRFSGGQLSEKTLEIESSLIGGPAAAAAGVRERYRVRSVILQKITGPFLFFGRRRTDD